MVLKRDLRAALIRLNPQLPEKAVEEAVAKLTHHDFSRALPQHNQAFHRMIRDGVPVSYRDAGNTLRHALARVIDLSMRRSAPRHQERPNRIRDSMT